MKQWECVVCGWIYDESIGDPDGGIAAGTRFEDIPDDWICPECGVGKDDFELIEVPDSQAAAEPPQSQSEATPDSPLAAKPVTTSTGTAPIVIVGSGLAGYGLLKELRKLDASQPVVIITSDDGRAYSKPMLSTAYTKDSTTAQLTQLDAGGMAAQYNASIWTMTRVSNIDTEQQIVSINEGSAQISYSKLVLALGASCVQPPLQGNASKEVFTINDLMDFAKFQSAVTRLNAKKVCVIGAGLIGCEYANDLLNGGFQVESVDPMFTCLATLLPEAAGKSVQAALEKQGAIFHFGCLATDIDKADNGDGLIINLDDGNVIEADIVLSAVGVRPRIELADESGIRVKRGICTNAFLETSANNVYALGDCAEVEGHVLVYIAPLMAASRALARTLSGTPVRVSYPAMPVAVKTPACPVVVSPPPADSNGSWSIVETDGEDVLAEFRSAEGNLLGFALTGAFTGERNRLHHELPALLP